MMNKKKFSAMIVILTLSVGFTTLVGEQLTNNNPGTVKFTPNLRLPNLYIDRLTPITINSDTDLATFAAGTGDGSSGNPYRIENYNVTTSGPHLISISHTTLHFSIANNSLRGLPGTDRGIQLYNVTNGVVKNNTVMNLMTQGIFLESSNNTIVANNTVFNCNEAGIELYNSSNNEIYENNVHNAEDGIRVVVSSDNNIIRENNASFNTLNGIRLEWDNRNNRIYDNILFNNSEHGIFMHDHGTFTQYWNSTQPTIFIYIAEGTHNPQVGEFTHKLEEWGYNWIIWDNTDEIEPNVLQLANILLIDGPSLFNTQQTIKNWWFSGNHTVWVAGDSDYNSEWTADYANYLLGNLTSNIMIQDDALEDWTENDGEPYRVVANETNSDYSYLFSPDEQHFLFHGPAPVVPANNSKTWDDLENTTWLINTSSVGLTVDLDNDDAEPWEYHPINFKGSYTLMAMETINDSTVLVSGEALFSDMRRMFGNYSMNNYIPYSTMPFIKNLLNHTLFSAEISPQSGNWKNILTGTMNNTISNNWVYNNSGGIGAMYVMNCTISDNFAESNNVGMGIIASINCTIADNNITNCQEWSGLEIRQTYSSSFINNKVYENKMNAFVVDYSSHNLIKGNNAYKNTYVGIRLDENCNYNNITENFVHDNQEWSVTVRGGVKNILDNNTIYNSRYVGIVLEQGSYFNIISKNTIYNSSESGINLGLSRHNNVTDNTVYNNTVGVVIGDNSIHNRLSENRICNNSFRGIDVMSSPFTTIHSNLITNNTIQAIRVKDESHTTEIFNNTVSKHNGSGLFIFNSNDVHIFNNTISESAYFGYSNPDTLAADLSLWLLERATVNNNTIHNSYRRGIALWGDVIDSVVANNTIYDCSQEGIWVNYSYSNEIFDNLVYNTSRNTIALANSSDNLVTKNNLYNSSYGGVGLLDSDRNNISKNTIFNNDLAGIYVRRAHDNQVFNNSIYNSSWAIYLSHSDDNDIINNTAFNNNNGGIFLLHSEVNNIIDNIVNHNLGLGISLELSHTNTIETNQIYMNSKGGILLNSSSDSHITANIAYNNSIDAQIGLIVSSDYNIITGNIVYNGDLSGIFLSYSDNNSISSNTAFNNSFGGISLYYSKNNTIFGNNASKNLGQGIWLEASSDNLIAQNTVNNNAENGIVVFEGWGWAIGNRITNNTVSHNGLYGLKMQTVSSDNTVTFNNFVGNNLGGTSQGYDDGANRISQNYWDDWTTPDSDSNGIVDNPYTLMGDANNFDYFPLTSHYNGFYRHELVEFVLFFPVGGETLNKTVTIEWTLSADSLGHTITYTVYYSADGGTTWIILVANVTGTEFNWKTTSVSDGTNYYVRVEARCSEGLDLTTTSNRFTINNTDVTTTEPVTTTTPPTTEPVTTTTTIDTTTTSIPPETITISPSPGFAASILVVSLSAILVLKRKVGKSE